MAQVRDSRLQPQNDRRGLGEPRLETPAPFNYKMKGLGGHAGSRSRERAGVPNEPPLPVELGSEVRVVVTPAGHGLPGETHRLGLLLQLYCPRGTYLRDRQLDGKTL